MHHHEGTSHLDLTNDHLLTNPAISQLFHASTSKTQTGMMFYQMPKGNSKTLLAVELPPGDGTVALLVYFCLGLVDGYHGHGKTGR